MERRFRMVKPFHSIYRMAAIRYSLASRFLFFATEKAAGCQGTDVHQLST